MARANDALWLSNLTAMLAGGDPQDEFNAQLDGVPVPTSYDIGAHTNHDSGEVACKGLALLPGNASLIAYRNHHRRLFRPYVEGAGGGVPGYWNMTRGFALDWEMFADTASRDALILMRNNAAYVNSGDVSTEYHSRECAYAIASMIDCDRLGLVALNSVRYDQLIDWALDHIDQWLGPSSVWVAHGSTEIQPFMMGLTARALILHHETYGDSRVLPALIQLADRMRADWWNAAGERFVYQVYPDGSFNDPVNGDVLSILAGAFMAWIWKETGTLQYKTWAEEAFDGCVDSNDAYNPKQYNEINRYAFELREWADSTPSVTAASWPFRWPHLQGVATASPASPLYCVGGEGPNLSFYEA